MKMAASFCKWFSVNLQRKTLSSEVSRICQVSAIGYKSVCNLPSTDSTSQDKSACKSIESVDEVLKDENMPISDMDNPYKKEKAVCVLCKYKIETDYKNVRLLSQFVSPYTGEIVSQSVAGLCKYQYDKLVKSIRRSRKSGFMPFANRQPSYILDHRICDPLYPKYRIL